MKSRDPTSPAQEPGQTGDARPGGSALEQARQTDELSDVIDGAQLLPVLEEPEDEREDAGDTANLPKITRMPEGTEVVEHSTGSAEARWLLELRCQCGQGWFELEPMPAATCPHCGLFVYVKVTAPMPLA